MISFVNDYSENACPEIIEAIAKTNFEGNVAYSNDKYSDIARKYIKEKIKSPNAYIQILVGGTQANLIAICAFLRPHEAVIAVKTGHICVHETGAIESTGHKCIEVDGFNGKITSKDIEMICGPTYWENAGILTVKPKLVYISQSTEIGTVYSRNELLSLRKTCDKYNLLLYCDGARLSSALDCSDVSMELLANVCDAFYIGGTKNGALFGEAMIIINDNLKSDFSYIAKQRGGMLAKGWLLGLQFKILMENNLYEKNGHHANKMAQKLKKGLVNLGLQLSVDSPSNQLFVIFPDKLLNELNKEFNWEIINKIDKDNTEIRLVTSWATPESNVDYFLERIAYLKKSERL